MFFGDGAVQAGHFNESVNLAALWGLPVIFVCENNGFAEFTPRSAHTNVERVSDVVAPYGVTRDTVDGNDVLAVRDGVRRASSPRRATGEGPLLLECLTYRLRGHYEGDPAHYREALAAEDWQEKDPILRFQRHGVDAGWFGTRTALEAVAAEARDAVEEAVELRAREPGARARHDRGPGLRPRPAPAGAAPAAGGDREDHLPEGDQRRPGATPCAPTRSVFVIGEDVAEGGPSRPTAGLAEEFGTERVLNTPITEAAICGVAIGAAQSGLRPVLEIMFIDFITLAFDQLVNQAAKAHAMSGGQLSVPLVLRTQGGGGQRWGAQHSQSLEAWLTHVPGLKVVMPSRAADAAGPAGQRDRRPQPGRVRREQDPVLQARGGPGGARARCRSAAPGPSGPAAT